MTKHTKGYTASYLKHKSEQHVRKNQVRTWTAPNAGQHVQQQEYPVHGVEMQNSTATLEDSLPDSYKIKHCFIQYNLAPILLTIYLEELKTYIYINTCT